jgi:uncharacterized protein YdhG (YjbR/CyaY superfamily)
MAKTNFKSVDEYLATKPVPLQRTLARVRRVIREALPDADEVISYQIPAYRLNGRVVIYFAGWAEHFSIYPATGRLVTALGGRVAKYVASKGTLRFPLSEPVPAALIARIAKFRGNEVAGRLKAKTPARTRRAR